jgi:tetratricopeptide (TPR) repeat protein
MNSISIDPFLPLLEPFKKQAQKTFFVKGIILGLICCMIFLAIVGLIFTIDAVVAISLASIMLLVFLFYVTRLYLKESLLRCALEVKDKIEEKAQKESWEAADRAELFSRLALSTHFLPVNLLHIPFMPKFCETFLNRLLTFIAWSPVHMLGEVFFLAASDEHIQQIKKDPTNLPLHAALANCYVMLSHHYSEPIKAKPLLPWPGIFLPPAKRETHEFKAEMSSKNALEELTILQAFAPDELWVHDQLAISYKELKMPEKEIEEYEAILRLCPDDHQATLRLGILYFSQGKNAKGLEMYEKLKQVQPLLAEELIEHYGSYQPMLKNIM